MGTRFIGFAESDFRQYKWISLFHKTPVKVLGTAVYDIEELTSDQTLSEFFVAPGIVDTELYDAFCKWLRHTNQLNGSVWKRLPGCKNATGGELFVAHADADPSEDSPAAPRRPHRT